jgi:hypothetical protein
MALLLYSVIRRHMKATGRYCEPTEEREPPCTSEIRLDESLLGWYRNPDPWQKCVLLFTDKAIYSVDEWPTTRIAIEDIIDYEFPKPKTDVTGVRIRTRDGFLLSSRVGLFRAGGTLQGCLQPNNDSECSGRTK